MERGRREGERRRGEGGKEGERRRGEGGRGRDGEGKEGGGRGRDGEGKEGGGEGHRFLNICSFISGTMHSTCFISDVHADIILHHLALHSWFSLITPH